MTTIIDGVELNDGVDEPNLENPIQIVEYPEDYVEMPLGVRRAYKIRIMNRVSQMSTNTQLVPGTLDRSYKVEDMELPVRSQNVVSRLGIITMDDLCKLSAARLKGIRGGGYKTWQSLGRQCLMRLCMPQWWRELAPHFRYPTKSVIEPIQLCYQPITHPMPIKERLSLETTLAFLEAGKVEFVLVNSGDNHVVVWRDPLGMVWQGGEEP